MSVVAAIDGRNSACPFDVRNQFVGWCGCDKMDGCLGFCRFSDSPSQCFFGRIRKGVGFVDENGIEGVTESVELMGCR